jgi:hypothetical protein
MEKDFKTTMDENYIIAPAAIYAASLENLKPKGSNYTPPKKKRKKKK